MGPEERRDRGNERGVPRNVSIDDEGDLHPEIPPSPPFDRGVEGGGGGQAEARIRGDGVLGEGLEEVDGG